MGRSRKQDFDILVYVDPHKYYEYPFTKKASLAKLIGAINSYCKNHNKEAMLIVPGRLGTSSPELEFQ